jgi:hypothetical protein
MVEGRDGVRLILKYLSFGGLCKISPDDVYLIRRSATKIDVATALQRSIESIGGTVRVDNDIVSVSWPNWHTELCDLRERVTDLSRQREDANKALARAKFDLGSACEVQDILRTERDEAIVARDKAQAALSVVREEKAKTERAERERVRNLTIYEDGRHIEVGDVFAYRDLIGVYQITAMGDGNPVAFTYQLLGRGTGASYKVEITDLAGLTLLARGRL